MERITGTAYGLVMRQGLANGRAGTRGVRGIGDGALSPAKGERGHQAADGREEHRPMGKGPAEIMPAKFGLRLVSSRDVRRQNPMSVAPLGLRTSLVLVVSN